MLTVIIKGDMDITVKSFKQRDIPYVAMSSKDPFAQTSVNVDDRHRDALMSWFCEPPLVAPPGGYPPGTCLYYGKTITPTRSLGIAIKFPDLSMGVHDGR